MNIISSLMKDIFGSDVDLGDLYKGIETTGQQAMTAAGQLASQLPGMTAFRPFTVTSGSGQVMATPEGGFNIGLSPAALAQQEALRQQANYYLTQGVPGLGQMSQLQGLAGGLGAQFMAQSSLPTGARESMMYDKIRALQSPEEQRQRLALEERLASQGRLGVQTAQFGGTPEQLALSKAQTEAQNQAALMSIQQAQAEQAQQAALGSQYAGLMSKMAGTGMGLQQMQQQLGLGALGASYLPEQQALGMLSAAAPFVSIADVARRQGAGLYGETGMSALDAYLAAQLGQANLVGGVIPGVVQGLGNIAATGVEGLFDFLSSL